MGKKTEWKKSLKSCCIVIGLILCALLFVIGIPVLINESYKVKDGYITLWGADDVLSFYAVILSGIITIAALIVTIHYNGKNTEKQISLARSQVNVPFFIIDKVYLDKSQNIFLKSSDNLTWILESEFSKYKSAESYDKIIVELKNIGEGIAISPQYHINFGAKFSDMIPAFVQKENSLSLTYDLYSVLCKRFGEGCFAQEFPPFDDILILTYQNTLGIVFRQKIRFHHEMAQNRTFAVESRIETISHQYVDLQ